MGFPTIKMKTAAFRDAGLGLGLGDVQRADLAVPGAHGPHRLIGVKRDPREPDAVTTEWAPECPANKYAFVQ